VNVFCRDAVEKLIVNSRRLLILAGETDSPINIERLILSVPRSDAELGVDGLVERSLCVKCLAQAQDRLPGNFNQLLEETAEYFIDQLPKYSRRARGELENAIGALRGLRIEISIHYEATALRVAV
jgi:hypothetical protein